jgi:signal transduction histidine kinase
MAPKIAPILRTFTFRLASIYVALFSLSVILLFAYVYTSSERFVEYRISEEVKSQYYLLLAEYRFSGADGVKDRIASLIASDDDRSEIYMMVDRNFTRLAGNLNEWPKGMPVEGVFEVTGRWVRFQIEGARNSPDSIDVKAIMIPLSKYRFLLVGKTLAGKYRTEQAIIQTFTASLGITLLMAFFGALIMTRSVMRRINIINRSALDIMRGNLSARVPYNVGGDEFDDLSLNLNRMLDKIEALMESIGQFANNIAHDLRSPLTRIVSRLDAGLRTLKTSDPARKILEKNIADMQELIGTFNSILNISELEADTGHRDFINCDLSVIIGQLVEFYEPYASERHIHLTNELQGPLIIQGERHLLTQAFANLLDNAIKFSRKGGSVTVGSSINEEQSEITITDSGPGIPDAFHDKVFEKFFRMEQSRNTGGNGLGLSLVAAVARIHHITIRLENTQGGLRVRLILPV